MTTAADSLRRNGTKDGPGTIREQRDRRAASPCATSSTLAVAVLSLPLDGTKGERMDGQPDTGQDCHRSPGETVSRLFGERARDRPAQPDPVVVRWEKGRSHLANWHLSRCQQGIEWNWRVRCSWRSRGFTRVEKDRKKKNIYIYMYNFDPPRDPAGSITWKWLKTISRFLINGVRPSANK